LRISADRYEKRRLLEIRKDYDKKDIPRQQHLKNLHIASQGDKGKGAKKKSAMVKTGGFNKRSRGGKK